MKRKKVNAWVIVDMNAINGYMLKHGPEAAELKLRRELQKNGFDLRYHIAKTENYNGYEGATLYEQDSNIIEAGEEMKHEAAVRQAEKNNGRKPK